MTRIGSWELLEKIGAGSAALVWRARDASGRFAAFKMLRDERLDDPDARSRARQEIRILAALDHPNIAALLDHGEVEEQQVKRVEPVRRLWLALEWVAGRDLADAIAAGPMAQEQVLSIGEQIASALGAAHAAGVVHRDLSPRNVRLTPDGVVKLIDFGLAKVLDEGGSALGQRSMVTGVGELLGTAAWLSPEQLAGERAGASADIHALGVLLYTLAVGRPPFAGRNVLEVLQAIRAPRRPKPSSAGARCSEAFDALVVACMAREPSARPASASEVGRLLAGLAHG